MKTINISRHTTGLTELSLRHRMPMEEIIDRIVAHGIDREYEVFDWSPRPLLPTDGVRAVGIETFPPEPAPATQAQTA